MTKIPEIPGLFHYFFCWNLRNLPAESSSKTFASCTAPSRHPARRAHSTRSHSTAASSSAAGPKTPNTEHERRRTTTKRCCVPTRAQSRRRRSMGQAKTGCPPRQQGPVARAGRFPLPPMRAWLEQPHGRRHKAPPQPCALTTSTSISPQPAQLWLDYA